MLGTPTQTPTLVDQYMAALKRTDAEPRFAALVGELIRFSVTRPDLWNAHKVRTASQSFPGSSYCSAPLPAPEPDALVLFCALPRPHPALIPSLPGTGCACHVAGCRRRGSVCLCAMSSQPRRRRRPTFR